MEGPSPTAAAGRPAPPLLRKRRLAMAFRLLGSLLRPGGRGTWPPPTERNLPRLAGGIEILRDARGLPHVYAEQERDLYAALGFLQAADRFSMLDLLRHLGAGRLAEWAGNLRLPSSDPLLGGRSLLDVDTFVRPLGFAEEAARGARELRGPAREALEAFAEGVNAALRAMEGVYPAEYLLLGRVRPFEPSDVLLCGRASAFTVSLICLDNELTFDAVRGEVGDELARRLYPEAPFDAAPAYPLLGPASPEPPLHVPGVGSNNWAVSGRRARSGRPLFANDPHVPLVPLPTYWYHAHLECPEYRVQGGTFPGCPLFGFGHNGHAAWGCTTGYRDAWDVYRIHRLSEDRSRYRVPDGSRPLEPVEERYRVRFRGGVTRVHERCEHGVLYPGWRHHDGTELTVRLVPSDLAAWAAGYRDLAASRTPDELRDAFSRLNEGPFDFNLVYAHRDGAIGWQLVGRLPRRRRDGLFVRDAHDPEAQWEGFVPFEEMPRRIDPPEGFVATANSTVDPEDHGRIATLVHFEPRYRQERIETVLGARDDHDLESMAELQRDVHAAYALRVRDALLELLPAPPELDPAAARAREELARWDGQFDAASRAAPALHLLQKELTRLAFRPLLGRAADRYIAGRRALPRLQAMLLDPADPLRRDVEAAAGRSLRELAVEALRAALDRVERIDPERSGATWGEVQRIRLAPLLGELPGLRRRFETLEGPFPGDDYTVSPSRSVDAGLRLRAFVGASSRFLCDLADPEEGLFAHSSGPASDPGSRFHAGASRDWHAFRYFRSRLVPAGEVPDVVERFRAGPRATGGAVS